MSVDAPDDAIVFLQREGHEKDPEEDDASRLSRALALSQVLLITERHDEYLSLCTDRIFPLALAVWQAEAAPGEAESSLRALVLRTFAGLCLAPLFSTEFLEQLPQDAIRRAVKSWEELRPLVPAGTPALAVDLCLRAASRTLGEVERAQEIEARLAANPAARTILGETLLDEAIRELLTDARGLTGTP